MAGVNEFKKPLKFFNFLARKAMTMDIIIKNIKINRRGKWKVLKNSIVLNQPIIIILFSNI